MCGRVGPREVGTIRQRKVEWSSQGYQRLRYGDFYTRTGFDVLERWDKAKLPVRPRRTWGTDGQSK